MKSLVVAAALAVTASGAAFADDSSMSMWTGDSYAFFNNLDNHPGGFNTARAPQSGEQSTVAKSPRKELDRTERRIMIAGPSRTTRTNPFRDDTGG
jgi:hypothetical protein